MLNFIARFVLATFKLVFRIVLILGGLVFSSLASAVVAMLGSRGNESEQQHDEINQESFAYDKSSAIQAFAAGDCDEAQLAHFWASDRNK